MKSEQKSFQPGPIEGQRSKRTLKRRAVTQEPSMLAVALKCASLGWSILPVPPGSKIPYVKWKPYQTERANETQIKEWWREWPEASIGLVTGKISGLAVLDFDSPEAREAFEASICELPETIVSTTGRGSHYFFQYPETTRIRNSAGELYRDVDVRGEAGLIILPPSIHKSGRRYEWQNIDPLEMGLDDLMPLPDEVLEWASNHKPKRRRGAAGDTEPRASNLTLKPVPVGQRDTKLTRLVGRWFAKGLSRTEVEKLALAWNADLEEPLDESQVVKVIDSIEGIDAEASQDAIHQAISEMNQGHFVTRLGGKCVVVTETTDPTSGFPDIVFSGPSDFHALHAPWTVPNPRRGESGQKKTIKVSRLWFESPARREYEGLCFEPGRKVEGYYNLWRGFSVKPKQGKWDRFKAHIRDIICAGSSEHFEWLLAWMARLCQDPGTPTGASIVLRGSQGTGKGVFCHGFGRLFGQHYLHLSHQRHLVGRFNQHLKDKLIVFADEAVWSGDRSSEGILKSLITEPYIYVEPKGKDCFSVKNHINLILATNQNWACPAGLWDRRFFVLDVSDKHIQDRAYFKAIVSQMQNGGYGAMLYDLLEHNASNVDLSQIPATEGLIDQIERTMSPTIKYWLERLMAGSNGVGGEWSDMVISSRIYDDYIDYAKDTLGVRFRLAKNVFVRETCQKILPCAKAELKWFKSGARRVILFPDLATCRESFCDTIGFNVDWGE